MINASNQITEIIVSALEYTSTQINPSAIINTFNLHYIESAGISLLYQHESYK